MKSKSTKLFLTELFFTAVNAAKAEICMPRHLSNINPGDGLCILGAGKASMQMAQVLYQHFGEKCYGAIVTRHGYTDKSHIGAIKVLTASHPVPDQKSLVAAKELLTLAKNNPRHIPVIFLISGGGSSLISLPIQGLAFEEKIAIHRFLIHSGATINEINIVRKKLAGIKGNKLASVVKGKYQTLIISDIVNDDPALVASGPTISDFSTREQAIEILHKYKWRDINSVKTLLDRSKSDEKNIVDTAVNFTIIANAVTSIDAAVEKAKNDAWSTRVISYTQEGEAKLIAKSHAKLALNYLNEGQPVILFSGGELTVTLNEYSGFGGPNQEYLLALAIELKGIKGISAIACDTDGIDGSKDVAGAFIDHSTLDRARAKMMAPEKYLKNNQSYHFFHKLNAHIVTGPTHTNVNDFRAIIIIPHNSSK